VIPTDTDSVLEGGSDVDEVYGFALFHYAVAGVTLWF